MKEGLRRPLPCAAAWLSAVALFACRRASPRRRRVSALSLPPLGGAMVIQSKWLFCLPLVPVTPPPPHPRTPFAGCGTYFDASWTSCARTGSWLCLTSR
jgi:hypothetical protein